MLYMQKLSICILFRWVKFVMPSLKTYYLSVSASTYCKNLPLHLSLKSSDSDQVDLSLMFTNKTAFTCSYILLINGV